jgi:hypothetical protein
VREAGVPVVFNSLVTFRSGGKPSKRAVRRIERIAGHRHTALSMCIHGVDCFKALDAEEKRFALPGDFLFKNAGGPNL